MSRSIIASQKKYRTIDNKFSLSAINEEEKEEEEVDEEKVK